MGSTLPSHRLRSTGRWILAATTLASSTAFLLGSAVNIALPSIQTYFSTNISGIEWVANSQLIFLATLLLIGGALGDFLGRRRSFIIGTAVFTAAAILAGLSPTIGWLIGFQALQGIGSAIMVPQSLAIINISFPESRRGRVIGLWAGISGGIAALGPWLSGWLIQVFSWRAVFFINVPISLLALVIALLFIPEDPKNSSRKLDWTGALLIFLALLGIAFGLITGPVSGWSQITVLASLSGAAAIIIIFILIERIKKESLVPVEIFRNPLVIGSNIITWFLYFALSGSFFLMVLNFQQIQKYTPSEAGLGLLATTVLIACFAGLAGSLSDKIGPRLQMILGPFMVAVGAVLLGVMGDRADYLRHFLPGMASLGIGMALVIAPLTKSALMVQPEYSGSASGLNNAIARFAALMSVAILGAVMIITFTPHLQSTIDKSGLSPDQQVQIISQSNSLGGIIVPADFSGADKDAAINAIKSSFIFGFRWAMGICAGLALAAAIISALVIKNPVTASTDTQLNPKL